MGGRQNRDRMRAQARDLERRFSIRPKRTCPNCKQILMMGQGHFVPPSMGVAGFYACKEIRT